MFEQFCDKIALEIFTLVIENKYFVNIESACNIIDMPINVLAFFKMAFDSFAQILLRAACVVIKSFWKFTTFVFLYSRIKVVRGNNFEQINTGIGNLVSYFWHLL